MPARPTTASCPCGSPAFAACCAPYLSGAAVPPTAETLMRSRYSAYTMGDEAYLRATWHPSTLPPDAIIDPNEKLQWLGLEVKSALRLRQRKAKLPEKPETAPDSAPAGLEHDSVEFVARYRINGRAHRLHEISRFVREERAGVAHWFYLDGRFPD